MVVPLVGNSWKAAATTGPISSSVRTAAAWTLSLAAFQFAEDPVERLLDNDGTDIEQGINATHTHEDEEAVAETVGFLSFIALPLAAHHIPEANGAEGHKAEVKGLKVVPVLHGRVQCRRTACDQQSSDAQNEHYVVDRWFPALQTVILAPGHLSSHTGAAQLALVTPAHDIGQHRDDALQEEVEEEDCCCAAKESVEYQKDLTCNGDRSGHAKAWKEIGNRFCYTVVFLMNSFLLKNIMSLQTAIDLCHLWNKKFLCFSQWDLQTDKNIVYI